MTPESATPQAATPEAAKPFPFLTILGVLGGVLSAVFLVAFMLWYTHAPAPNSTEKSPEEKLLELRRAEEAKLKSYEWIQKSEKNKPGVVRIPYDRAAEKLLQEENKK
ncbi:MAG TPA: hypothetical protein VKS79_00310 [Gemmataceae bacterium]|nr:hypothetical protein [Gemmataceae bacterium]